MLSHLVSPTLSGGPKWPALRQAFRLVRRPNGNIILASDGLSDPFDDITLGTSIIPTGPGIMNTDVYGFQSVEMPRKGPSWAAMVEERP